jgi:hypothetical protein
MSQNFWLAEGVSIGDGDEVADSVADRLIKAQGYGLKIDGAAVSGLTGTANSLAYKVHEIERHFHGRERWFGKLAVQTATDWADNTLAPFIAISGNNAYGTDANDEALVFGTADTPVIAGNVRYDLHRVFVSASSVAALWKLQLIYGSGTMADAIAAEQFSTFMVRTTTPASTQDVPVDIMMPRGTCGSTKVWLRAWCATNDATISFFVGTHEYEG